MSDIEAIIDKLCAETTPVKPLAFLPLLAEWLAVCAAYVTIILAAVGLREDVLIRLSQAPFQLELGLLFATMLAAAFSVYLSSFPDLKQMPWGLAAPLLPFGGFLVLLTYLNTSPLPATEATLTFVPHGWECMGCVLLYGFVPAIWLVFRLRRQTSTQLAFTGGMCVLAGATAACLALRLAEPVDDPMHMLQWHYLPMTLFALVGMSVGRKFFKW